MYNTSIYSSQGINGHIVANITDIGTDNNIRIPYYDDNCTRIRRQANLYSTNIYDLYEIKRRRFKSIMPDKMAFANLLHHTVFEDGMSNSAIELVRRIYLIEPYMTIVWIYQLYGLFPKDSYVLNGILRIIAFLEFPEEDALSFIPLLRLSLIDESIHCQESAIMLCEVWRSAECYEALKEAKFSDYILKNYAESVMKELSIELIKNAS